jgi:hypothetical protein
MKTTFKLGIRAIHQKNIKTAITQAKRNGFDILEIHLSSPQFQPQSYKQNQLSEIRDFAKKSGITLQTHSEIGQSLIQADEILRKAEKLKLRQIIQFSQKIGARCLTLHIGDAPGYNAGPGNHISNDALYSKFYSGLFEDSVKYIISIAPKDLFVCVENDSLLPIYQKILNKYLPTNKVFLTWDLMKSYTFEPTKKLRKDQFQFMVKNINYVRNVHISGPGHAGLEGYENDLAPFIKLLQDKNIPVVFEVLSLPEAILAKKIVQNSK